MTRLVLSLFDGIRWLLRWAGVDYAQFRAILEVKLTIDTRVRGTAVPGGRSRRKSPRNTFAWTLGFNALMGVFVAMVLQNTGSPLVGMTFVHSFVMLMVAMALVADFSTVLLDTTDSQILQPRPVSSRTILAARLAHITTYLSLITLSVAAGSFVVGTFVFDYRFPLVFAATLAANVILVVGLVAALYLLLMRLIDEEKLRDLITYVQIAMAVVVVGSYQFAPRLVDASQLRELRIDQAQWIFAYPPAWFAAPVDLLVGNGGATQNVLTGLAIAAPLIVLVLVARLAPAFRITPETAATSGRARRPGGEPLSRRSLGDWIAARLIRDPVERATFGFLWRISTRDRQFKRRTYPSIAFIFVFAAVYIFARGESVSETLATLHETKKYLLPLYFSCIVIPSALACMRFSDQPEAAWIYVAGPFERPGIVLAAALKVLVLQLVVPALAIVTLVVLVLWGPVIIPDIVLASGANLVVCAFYASLMRRTFPFSEAYGMMDSSGRSSRMLLLMVLMGALGGGHYALTFVPLGVPLAIPVVFALGVLLTRRYGRIGWAAFDRG